MTTKHIELKNKVLKGYKITSQEALYLSEIKDKQALYDAANEIRIEFCGSKMELCSITNAKSGRCSQNCKWCSQSAHYTTNISEYEIVNSDTAIKEASNNFKKGVSRHSLVTSGRSVSNQTLDQLIPIYKQIRAKTNIGLCASMGLIDKHLLDRLKTEAGVECYHCNLETAPSFFHELVSSHTQAEKIKTIKLAQELGMKVCSGGIIGMGEQMKHRVELACTLRDLGIESIPINILTPVKGTPLESVKPLLEEEVLTTIAIFRFINPNAQIRFAGGRLQIKHFQQKALKAGVNAALTGDYLTTTGAGIDHDICEFKAAGFQIKNNSKGIK